MSWNNEMQKKSEHKITFPEKITKMHLGPIYDFLAFNGRYYRPLEKIT